MKQPLLAFWQFSRPHTVVGTTLSVGGLYTIAWAATGGAQQPGLLLGTLAAALSANIYIVGLNQITDVEIDRMNKPELPLASGAFSMRTAVAVVISALLLALLLSLSLGPYLLLTVLASMLVGTIYSLPPFRLKRFHFWAAASIFSVRGLFVNLFLFLHFFTQRGAPPQIPAHVWALTAFILGLSLVIAWLKDIPDMSGDRHFRIATLSLKLGARPVLRLGVVLLSLCYAGLALAALFALPAVNGPVLAGLHALLLLLLWRQVRRLDPASPAEMKRFYMFVWGLFFAEYLVFPLACLLA